MECAPIIISVYDRLDHLKKCINLCNRMNWLVIVIYL